MSTREPVLGAESPIRLPPYHFVGMPTQPVWAINAAILACAKLCMAAGNREAYARRFRQQLIESGWDQADADQVIKDPRAVPPPTLGSKVLSELPPLMPAALFAAGEQEK